MLIAIGSDHRGFEIKKHLILFLNELHHEVLDKGSFNKNSTDYPMIAQMVAQSIRTKESERGILFCGTGIGVSISANRILGIRAALCHNKITTEFSIKHNNANIFCFGTEVLSLKKIKELLECWLTLRFDEKSQKNTRHCRRIKLIDN